MLLPSAEGKGRRSRSVILVCEKLGRVVRARAVETVEDGGVSRELWGSFAKLCGVDVIVIEIKGRDNARPNSPEPTMMMESGIVMMFFWPSILWVEWFWSIVVLRVVSPAGK